MERKGPFPSLHIKFVMTGGPVLLDTQVVRLVNRNGDIPLNSLRKEKKETPSLRDTTKKTKIVESYYKHGRLETREEGWGDAGEKWPRRVRWVFSTRDLCS